MRTPKVSNVTSRKLWQLAISSPTPPWMPMTGTILPTGSRQYCHGFPRGHDDPSILARVRCRRRRCRIFANRRGSGYMKILISSYPFHPSVGGLEEVTDLLANEYVARGHVVKIVTMTPSMGPGDYPFEVIRNPTVRALIQAVKWCDVYVQHQISLRFAWPLLLVWRPWIVAQLHTLGNDPGIFPKLRRSIKRTVIGLSCHVVACS